MAARHRQKAKLRRQEDVRRRDEGLPCGECPGRARLVKGDVVYPHRPDLHAKDFWRCEDCGACVGCHKGTLTPLGTPGSPTTLKARRQAHALFDPLWRRKMAREGVPQHEARGAAYRWLSEQLGLAPELTHIGMFDAATARRVVELCEPFHRGKP